MDQTGVEQVEEEFIICPNCGEMVEGPEFCQRCLCPIGATTNLDPIRTIQGEGFALRAGIRHASNPYVLAAMWMIGVPAVLSPAWIFLLGGGWGWTTNGALLLVNAVGAALYASILYKATRRFLTARHSVAVRDE